jgi:hypothetical protein
MALTGRQQQIRAGQTGGALNVTLDARNGLASSTGSYNGIQHETNLCPGLSYRIAVVSPSRTETIERLK